MYRSLIAPRNAGDMIAAIAAREYAVPIIAGSLFVARTRPSVANQEPKTANSSSIIALNLANMDLSLRSNSSKDNDELDREEYVSLGL
jgi:hypothetical protein